MELAFAFCGMSQPCWAFNAAFGTFADGAKWKTATTSGLRSFQTGDTREVRQSQVSMASRATM